MMLRKSGRVKATAWKAVATITGCKPYFRPEAGKMIPAPSGLQEVDGLNHLLENPRPDRYSAPLCTSQSPRRSHCPNYNRNTPWPTDVVPRTTTVQDKSETAVLDGLSPSL